MGFQTQRPRLPKRPGPRKSIIPSGALIDNRLSPTQFRVLALLCCSTDRQGHTIRSQNKMAKELRVARSTVQRALDQPENTGWIKRVDNRRPDGGRCSLGYIVNYGDEALPEDLKAEDKGGFLYASHEAGVAAPVRHAVPERCGNSKNAKSNNELLKTDTVDKFRFADPLPGPNNPNQKLVLSVHELQRRAKEATPFIEKVKQQLLFVGIHLEHSSISDGLDTILEWHALGADIDQDIAPMLEKVMTRCSEAPRSLRYFTKAIQNSVKRRQRNNTA
ncbi:hypothetical protein [Roseibium sp.]|uniref:hypothetical protein n=1 Tax=Roseibium sp. TaxID=1936156 RepID=UPI003B510D9E